jgi:hypothetical protein
VPKRLKPGEHDFLPAPKLIPETELEHMLSAGAKSLWYGITFPIRKLSSAFWPPKEKVPPPPNDLVGCRKPSNREDVEELHDALSPSNDQLRLERFWWFLESIPLKHKKGKTAHLSYNPKDYYWMYVFPSDPILRHISYF